MELRQIRHFEAVYRLRSISRAAEEQHLTQSALSRSLKALETKLGQRLFDRSTHEVVPTLAADELLPHAIDALAAVSALEQTATVLAGGRGGLVRLGTGSFPLQPLISETMRTLSAERPDIQVVVTGGRPADLVGAMVRREFDAVVCDTSKFEAVDALAVTVEPLAAEPLVIIVGKDHALTQIDPTNRDLARHPWAMPTMSPAALRRMPTPFKLLPAGAFPRYQIDVVTTCLDIVADQRTVTLAPLSLARRECPTRGLVFRPTKPSSTTRDGIHLLRARTAAKATRMVLDHITEHAAQLAEDGERWLRSAAPGWTDGAP